MNTLIILLAQTKGEATIEILSFLLVAAIIGYVTAWLFYKSVYEKRIKAVEADKHELNNRIVNLDGIVVDLKKKLSVNEKEKEQLQIDSNARKKNLLDYDSFGRATFDERDDLKMISGIGPVIEERLHSVDIYTFRQISKFSRKDIETIDDAIIYFSGRIDRDEWVAQAKELVNAAEHRTALFKRISERKAGISYGRIGVAKIENADNLTVISGIGGWIEEKLNVLDIFTYKQISNFTKEDVESVTEAIEYFPGRIERDDWIVQAKELVRIAGDKSDLIRRIKERKGRIYYDRLGYAHKHEANNLTRIDGLGLWVEERLNTLDIYTFDQISKLTHADIEIITEVFELIPGQIEKDNWVGQASELVKKQYTETIK